MESAVVVPMAGRRRKLWFSTTTDGVTRNYFRPPPGLQLPDDMPNRLPDQAEEAARRANELLKLCIPFGRVKYRGRRGGVETLLLASLEKARKRAALREISFDISAEDVVGILRAQQYRCAISGLPFRTETKADCGAYRAPFRPSIDRIDARLGYLKGNIRIVLVAVNVALSDWGEDVLVTIAHAISDRTRRMEGPL